MTYILPAVLSGLMAVAVAAWMGGRDVLVRGAMALAWWAHAAGDLTVWHFPAAACLAVPMAVRWTWLWLNSWKDKRRRARALIGAKSRALRDKLVRRLAGERARRPVLVPS